MTLPLNVLRQRFTAIKGSIGVGRKGERESVKSVRFWVEIFTRSQPTKLWSFKISYAVISK